MSETSTTTVRVNGSALREIRVRTGVGMQELADQVGISRSYLSLIENGRRTQLSPGKFAQLLAALHINDRRVLMASPDTTEEAAAV